MNLLWKIFTIGLLILIGIGKNGMSAEEVKIKHKYTNRLANEKSPYLLQHAHNPVDWYPWGEEAFAKAKREDKPIFLSIGYSTCHWCHVMEHESFSDPEVAELMNKHFVSIKVDREERPDVDQIYMTAVMSMTGSGGWPLSVFLTTDRLPFYGGTYYPPKPVWGRPSFTQVLNSITDIWENRRDEAIRTGTSLALAIEGNLAAPPQEGGLNKEVLTSAFDNYQNGFDEAKGGFETAPKFPRAHSLSLLLRYHHRTKDKAALYMVEKTLEEMAKGGIYDHLGGGFHRYSTDEKWLLPHFEKMLYDQAINGKAYLEAYQVTQNENYARTARETLDYVLRDMTSTEGGFYSAEDADSPLTHEDPDTRVEGTFYVFEETEIEKLLGKKNAEIINFAFGVRKDGNAGTGAHGELKKKNVLSLAQPVEAIAKKFKKTEIEIDKILAQSKKTLFEARAKRPRPHLDDKIMTDWNGLMISTFAFAGRVLQEPRYTKAAQKAADFILTTLREKDGRLLHRFRDGHSGISGFLEDYAFFIHSLVDLYEATFDIQYLKAANELTTVMVDLFWDEQGKGFFLTSDDAEKLIARTKEIYDGAIPSGNSVALLDLIRVGRLTMNQSFEEKAQEAFSSFASKINAYPTGYPQMLIAFDFAVGPSKEIVIAGEAKDPLTEKMVQLIYSQFIPNKVVALRPTDPKQAASFIELVPFAKDQTAQKGKPTVYVCENYVCQLPTTDLKKLKELL